MEVFELSKKVKGFASSEEFEVLQKNVIPKVAQCELEVREYRKDNKDMRVCIRTFDSQICQKASKVTVKGVEDKMYNDYASKEDLTAMAVELEWKQKNKDEKTGVFIENMSQFQKNVEGKLRRVCEEVVEDKLEAYESVSKEFSKFLHP